MAEDRNPLFKALEDTVLDFEEGIADRLLFVRLSHVYTLVDELLTEIWAAEVDHEYVVGSEAIGD